MIKDKVLMADFFAGDGAASDHYLELKKDAKVLTAQSGTKKAKKAEMTTLAKKIVKSRI